MIENRKNVTFRTNLIKGLSEIKDSKVEKLTNIINCINEYVKTNKISIEGKPVNQVCLVWLYILPLFTIVLWLTIKILAHIYIGDV